MTAIETAIAYLVREKYGKVVKVKVNEQSTNEETDCPCN